MKKNRRIYHAWQLLSFSLAGR